MRKREPNNDAILTKANLVLNLVLMALLLIGIRIWHLTVVQYDDKFEQSRKPQRKSVIELATRATIRDRFNLPLAINKVAYRATVAYAPIRQVPATSWEVDEKGQRVKKFKRKEYIQKLAQLLGQELQMDAERVEDLIYSKAALYFNIPYVLKEEISEKEYYHLKLLEKDWPGLIVQRYSKREYPQGKCASDLIGYMGAISREEYEANIREMKGLSTFLTQWENGENPPFPEGFTSVQDVRVRHKDLEELAYTTQDFVGKMGIEAVFEQHLRGFQGKKSFYSDSRGNHLVALPGARDSLPGKRILLTISQELQEYAEALLAQSEEIRQANSSGHGKKISNQKQPWIKGGAIVALDPHTGEVLALASYPRFDPNDFIVSPQSDTAKNKRAHINRWFENDAHIADLWNQQWPLQRERYDSLTESFYEEEKWLTWSNYLDIILPAEHPISQWFKQEANIQKIVKILRAVDQVEKETSLKEWLKSSPPQEHPLSKLLEFLPSDYTKLLFIDCCQLAVDQNKFSSELLEKVGQQKIQMHHEATGAFVAIQEGIKQISKELFHSLIFSRWRKINEKAFLKGKRDQEKLSKSYPKPYLDYLDEKEQELFNRFWNLARYELMLTLLRGESNSSVILPLVSHFKQLHHELNQGAHPGLSWNQDYHKLKDALKGLPDNLAKEYISSLRPYQELTRPLKSKYKNFRNGSAPQLEKHLAAAFYPTYGYGYGRSHAYRQATTQGSIFKLVTAHETLLQLNQESLKNSKSLKIRNPITVTDENFKIGQQQYVGYTESGKPIPQQYKGGRIPRSHSANMGKMDLMRAIETSSNLYFSLLASDVLKSPFDLALAAKKFGYGAKTGIELPGEIAGKVPTDLDTNRTGLYAMPIGQHTLVVTPLQTSLMLGAIANRGDLLIPHIVRVIAGAVPTRDTEDFDNDGDKDEKLALSALGLDFSLFDSNSSFKQNKIEKNRVTVRRHIEMADPLRKFLLEAMHRVVVRTQAESLWTLSKLYANHPEAISDYIDLKNQIVGKTSTSESMERIDLDEHEGTNLYTHTWFGGVSFEDDVTRSLDRPELVVVVYLRFGSYGKEAAPVAAQIVRKWREIKQKRT